MTMKLPTAHEAYATAKGISDKAQQEDLEAFRALVFTTVDKAIKAPANLLETNPSWAIGEDGDARGYRVRMVEDPRG